jgi:hypothetical protein
LVEEHKGRTHDVIVPDDDEAESAMASAQSQREEELQVRKFTTIDLKNGDKHLLSIYCR